MHPVALDIALASLLFLANASYSWRLVWPRWKLFGRALSYLGAVAVLSLVVGHWSLLLALLHQGLGLAFHLWFCRRHGFTWYAVEDPERYVALSKAMVGYLDLPEPTARDERREPGVRLPDNVTMQCAGELPTIEWRVDVEEREP